MKRFPSSRKRLILLAGLLLAFLLVLNISTYLLYQRAKVYLDHELGERLRSIAVTLSHAVEASTMGLLDPEDVDPDVVTLLHTAKAENLLSNIVLLTADGLTVADLGNLSTPGELNPFIELDYSAVTLARSGLSAYTNLYKSDDTYLKSAYAPITSPTNDVIGILGVEAGVAYFDVLRALTRAILVIDIISVILIALLGLFFYHQSLSLDRAQAAIIQGENLATMGRMVAGIAHEIRNPLSIIKTSAERIEKKYDLEDEALSYISEEVDELDRILTGYLNFSKAESAEPAPHSLQRIVDKSIHTLTAEAKTKHVSIQNRLPAADVMVMCDDKRIQQAVLNLLLNAIQAVDRAGRIELTLRIHGGNAVLGVEDNGAGIPARHLKEITKPFFTTKEHGSGLGMSIVSRIVEEHGGALDIESTEGKGTKISISLPRAVGG